MRILAICGSLRKQSFNLSLLRAAAAMASPGVEIVIHPLDDLPFFNSDIEDAGAPVAVKAFHAAIEASDGFMLATPEYDHAYSGVLKNALDWCSHADVLDGKPTTTMSASTGPGGGTRSQMALREVLYALGCDVMSHAELLVRGAGGKFDQQGTMTDLPTRESVNAFVVDFAAFISSRTKIPA